MRKNSSPLCLPPPCFMHSITCCLPSDYGRDRKGGRLYIFTWCILKLEVSKQEKALCEKRKSVYSLISTWTSIGWESYEELQWRRGWAFAGEERGRLSSWRVGRIHNKARLHLFPRLLFYAQFELCISVHGSYASPRIANGKMDTLKKLSCATRFKQTVANNNTYRYLVLEVDQMKDAYRNLDYDTTYGGYLEEKE